MNLHVWTPDSGTVELPRVHRGIPLADAPTSELWLLDLRPSVPRRYEQPNLVTFLARLWFRILCSPAADHLRAARRATFWPPGSRPVWCWRCWSSPHLQCLTPTTGCGDDRLPAVRRLAAGLAVLPAGCSSAR